MPEEPKDQPTQGTPKGATIPVPKRKDVFGDLAKVAKPRTRTVAAPKPKPEDGD